MQKEEVQFRPQLLKFEEIIKELNGRNMKKANKLIANFSKSKFPKGCPPFLQTAKALELLFEDKYREAVNSARAIEKLQPTNEQIVDILYLIFDLSSREQDSHSLLVRLNKKFPQNLEHMINLLYLNLSLQKFAEAQMVAMSFFKHAKSPAATMVLATCCYLRAKKENSMVSYKLAIGFLDKVDEPFADTVTMKAKSMIELGNVKEALDFWHQESVQKIMSYDPISYKRLEITCYSKLGRNDDVAKVAESFLREINVDSIDEWKLVVKYHQDAQKLIDELYTEKNRGPRLAKIELYIQKGLDILPLLEEYISNYKDKECILGDLRPYLNDEVLSKLTENSNVYIKTLATNKFEVENIDTPKLASVLTQDALRKNDKKQMIEAFNACMKFVNKYDARVSLIRLAGLLGLTVYQNKLWHEQKLEGINYLSLASLYLNDHINNWDFQSLSKQLDQTDDYVLKSLQSFERQLQKSTKTLSFLVLEDAINFKYSIVKNINNYISYIINMWLKMVNNLDTINEFNAERFLDSKAIAELEERRDTTILPIYFRDENIQEMLLPSTSYLLNIFDPVVKALFYLKLSPSKVDEELSRITEPKWQAFTDFVKKGTFSISSDADIYVIGSIALANKIKGGKCSSELVSQLKNKLNEKAEMIKKSLHIEGLPDSIKETIEEQEKHLMFSVASIEKLFS